MPKNSLVDVIRTHGPSRASESPRQAKTNALLADRLQTNTTNEMTRNHALLVLGTVLWARK